MNYLRKSFHFIMVLLGAMLVIQFLMFLIPGDAAQSLAGEYASQETVDRMRSDLALDQGFAKRYIISVEKFFMLDWGKSIYSGEPVLTLIMKRFPATLALALVSMLMASITGILLGILAAIFVGKWPEKVIMEISAIFIATPIFVTCLLLTLVFSYYFYLFPPSGINGADPRFIVLPAVSLASRSLALIIRVTRNELLEVLQQNYIKVTRAMGLKKWKIILVYAFKNIVIPVITVIFLDFGAYLGGAVVTESVFAWPGIGRLMIVSLQKRDLPVVQGVILFGTFLFILINIQVDWLQRKFSPKIS